MVLVLWYRGIERIYSERETLKDHWGRRGKKSVVPISRPVNPSPDSERRVCSGVHMTAVERGVVLPVGVDGYRDDVG